MSKGLPAHFFRIRLFKRNKPVFVWEIADFFAFSDMALNLQKTEVRNGDTRADFLHCHVSTTETLLASIKVDESALLKIKEQK